MINPIKSQPFQNCYYQAFCFKPDKERENIKTWCKKTKRLKAGWNNDYLLRIIGVI